jgi:hypothetical protein
MVSFAPNDASDYLPSSAQVTIDVVAPAVVQLAAVQFEGSASSGSATVVLTRSGSTSTTATVSFTTTGGSALPVVDYTPVDTTVIFAPGQTSQSVTIPLRDDPRATGPVSVGLTIGSPGPTTALGSPAIGSLLIADSVPAPLIVTGVQLQKVKSGRHKTSTVIDIAFNAPLDPAAAVSLASYELESPGKGKKTITRGVKRFALAGVTYNATTRMVTLTPRKPLVLAPPLELRVLAAGLTDTLGRALGAAVAGGPGTNYTATLSKRGVTAGPAT